MTKVTKQAGNGGRALPLFLVAVGIAFCAALPAATVTTEGTVLTIDVDDGESYTNSTALASPITEVVKTGAGTAVFTAASANFAGTINVNAGTAQFTVLDAYGTGPINVADGAAMVVSHNYTEQLITAVKGTVTIAGAGPDGNGALLFTGAGNADQIFQKVVLSANATWGGRRCGARTVDFGGHELTWCGVNLMALDSHWQNFGGLVHRGSSTITFQNAPTFDASCTNGLITLASSGGISFWTISVKIPFSLKVESDAVLVANAGSGEWAGPIEVASGSELKLSTGSASRTLIVSGAVTGTGAMRLTGTSAITLSGGANSIAGDLVATNGTVTLKIPGDSSLDVAGALRGNAILKKTGAGRLLEKKTAASPERLRAAIIAALGDEGLRERDVAQERLVRAGRRGARQRYLHGRRLRPRRTGAALRRHRERGTRPLRPLRVHRHLEEPRRERGGMRPFVAQLRDASDELLPRRRRVHYRQDGALPHHRHGARHLQQRHGADYAGSCDVQRRLEIHRQLQ